MAKAMQPQKMRFSQAIQTPMYKSLVNNTLGDPARGARFIANITSAVAVNPALQECNPGTILAGALLGESLLLQPSPQLGQFYLVPFKSKAKRDRHSTDYDQRLLQRNCRENESESFGPHLRSAGLRTGRNTCTCSKS